MADQKTKGGRSAYTRSHSGFYATKLEKHPLGPKACLRVLFCGVVLATAASFVVGTWYFRFRDGTGLNADVLVSEDDKSDGEEGYTCSMMTSMYPRTVTCECSTRPACCVPCPVCL